MKELAKYIFRGLKYRYKIDPNEINYILKNIKEGNILVDIGANKGGYLYWMQKKVSRRGIVYAFEPQEKLFNYLNKISALRKYSNVVIENLGMSSNEREVSFFIPQSAKGDSQGARIDCLNDGTLFDELRIKTTTLDKYFFDQQIYPDLIKIDVEGHEKQVIYGGSKLLKSFKPTILLECENRHLEGEDIFDVFKVLIEFGYDGYFFENKKLKTIKDFNIDIHQKTSNGRFWEADGYINNFVFKPTLANKT